MKIDITIRKNNSLDEIKTLASSEKLILASPCQIKYQEQWLNELLQPSAKPLLKFTDQSGELSMNEYTCLYAPFFLQAQHITTGLEFLNWWCDLLGLSQKQITQSLKKLKQLGIQNYQMEQNWKDISFHHKIILLLAPAGLKFKMIHLMLGDYFVESHEQVAFNNQITSWLAISDVHLVLFWTYTVRELKATKLFFTGFKSNDLPEENSSEKRSSK